jgi:hypothetical protein
MPSTFSTACERRGCRQASTLIRQVIEVMGFQNLVPIPDPKLGPRKLDVAST